MGSGGVDSVDGAIAINGGGIDGDFVSVRYASRFAGKRKRERFRIAPSQAKTGVQKAAPEVSEVRMAEAVDLIIVSLLLGVVADADDDVLGSGDRAGIFGSHFEFAVAGGYNANNGLAILKSEMERFCGNDRSDGVPLEANVACELRLE